MKSAETRVRSAFNPFREKGLLGRPLPGPNSEAKAFHQGLPGYSPRPLAELPGLADSLGVKRVYVKDEAERFGLPAFKALGASYAVHRRTQTIEGKTTLCTATDGNHGRAVAWIARTLGHRAVIFVPSNTVDARIEAIRSEGAECVVFDGNYDETVVHADRTAAREGWHVISDTAYEGYTEVPDWIMGGYSTIFLEMEDSLEKGGLPRPTHVFAQAGVGGLACAAARHFSSRSAGSTLICVEPTDADCLLESAAHPEGALSLSKGQQNSIMAGLNCGTPSMLAWPEIRETFEYFLAIDDGFAEAGMRTLAKPLGTDPRIVAGESGAAGMGGLLALCSEDALARDRERLSLDRDSVVLVVNTEGATDPAAFERIVGEKP